LLQCRTDDLLNMVQTRGGKQHHLHGRAKRFGSARQDHVPDGFSTRRTAGLTGQQNRSSAFLQMLLQQANLGRLTRALAAFKCNEKSPQARLPVSRLAPSYSIDPEIGTGFCRYWLWDTGS